MNDLRNKKNKTSVKVSASAITLKNIMYTAVFAAIICVTTMTVKIPIGSGYYHAGDAFIYFAAVCLPFPYAVVAAALGGALSDLLLGYANYIIATFIIKACMTIFFTNKKEKILCVKNFIAVIIGASITIGGYYIAEIIMYGNSGALPNIPGNLIQAAASTAAFAILAAAIDKTNMRNIIFKSTKK